MSRYLERTSLPRSQRQCRREQASHGHRSGGQSGVPATRSRPLPLPDPRDAPRAPGEGGGRTGRADGAASIDDVAPAAPPDSLAVALVRFNLRRRFGKDVATSGRNSSCHFHPPRHAIPVQERSPRGRAWSARSRASVRNPADRWAVRMRPSGILADRATPTHRRLAPRTGTRHRRPRPTLASPGQMF